MTLPLPDCRICLDPLTRETTTFYHDHQRSLPHFLHPICFAQWLRNRRMADLPVRCPSCLSLVHQIFRGSPLSSQMTAESVDEFISALLPPTGPIPKKLTTWSQTLIASVYEQDWAATHDLLIPSKMDPLRKLRPKWFDRCLGTAFEIAVSKNHLDTVELLLGTNFISKFSLQRGVSFALKNSLFTIADAILAYIISRPEELYVTLLSLLQRDSGFAVYLFQESDVSNESLNDFFITASRLGQIDFVRIFLEQRPLTDRKLMNQARELAHANQHEHIVSYLSAKCSDGAS